MKIDKIATVLLASFLLLATAAVAQKSSPAKGSAVTAYKLIALKVTGSQRYTEKEILPASGLALGQNVGEADFKEAARRLGDTGLFTDVVYSFSFSPAGTKLELQLTDAGPDALVPAHFENFVWFSDAELLNELQRRVPLFNQQVPVAGTMPDRVEEALQAILDEKQIAGRVDYLRQSPQEGGKLTGIAYRVDALDMRIQSVAFPGATPDQLPALQVAARRLTGAPYLRSPLAMVARADFMPVCLQRGYLKASFADANARVVSESGADVEVEAIFPLTPGKVYSTSSVEWKGNAVISVGDLQRLIHLPVGQPADAVRLGSDLEKVAKLYHTRGYMVARITPQPVLDDDNSTVHYDLNVVEGDQYKMGELDIMGLDSQAKARVAAAWKLPEGVPYNAEYPKTFLTEIARILPAGVAWSMAVHEGVNEKDKTVDVTLRFTPR